MKIVIADDNNTDRLILKRILKSFGGYEVHSAANGAEAVELFQEVKPDIVLLDALMPVMDGYAATSAIRHAEATSGRPRIPIIGVTGDADVTQHETYMAAGMNACLVKPVTIKGLSRTIARVVQRADEA